MKKITKIIYVYDDGSTSHVDIQNPFNTPIPSMPSPSTYPIKSNCPKCGIGLTDVMGYCCPQPNCPTGLGGIQC